MESEMIRLRDVRKSYMRKRVLDVNRLSMSGGKPVLVIGSNGSGKSTLLRVLAGVTRIDAGRIQYNEVLRSGTLGYLPQHGGLYDDLTVRENFLLRRHLHGRSFASPNNEWYVEGIGLGPFLDTRVSSLSGGFARLAAIAALFHAEPSWILLDEPFTGIDGKRRRLLIKHIATAAKMMPLLVVAAPTQSDAIETEAVVTMSGGRPQS